ncbi:hypothetical protein BGX33_000646 [Mortierella sp. NVP41]|nr:hypothetical protein BGX33_000646 [Mortierella sp. NVP41]
MSVSVQPSVPVSVPATISFAEKPVMPTTTNNNRVTTNTTATNSGTPGATNPITRKGSISEIIGQTVILTEPHNTLYVTHQGGARNQALGVDQPTISSTSHTTKSQTQSGLGVDKPIYVGIHEDPKTQIRRRGTLHVDKTPVFVDDALLSDPNNRDQDSYTANIVENNNTNPKLLAGAPANDTFSRRRRWSFSALNVDSPSVPTANIAGSGSTDKTNRSRPVGIYNSGYNVDRAGHHDQKTSGLHVDQPAVTTHQMAAVPKPQQSQSQQQQQQPFSSTTTTTTFNTRSHSPTFNKLHNPTNSAVNPYATTTTITQTQLTPAEMGPTINYQPTSNNSSSSSAADAAAGATNNNSMVIPADYHGPIPQVAPGEQVIWVKKTVVKTDYYEGDHGNAAGPTPPAPVQESAAQSRRSSTGSILDRLRGRRASVDKGKQRVDS